MQTIAEATRQMRSRGMVCHWIFATRSRQDIQTTTHWTPQLCMLCSLRFSSCSSLSDMPLANPETVLQTIVNERATREARTVQSHVQPPLGTHREWHHQRSATSSLGFSPKIAAPSPSQTDLLHHRICMQRAVVYDIASAVLFVLVYDGSDSLAHRLPIAQPDGLEQTT